MNRIIVNFENGYINIPAEEMHEDGDFIKIYSEHNGLIGIFRQSYINCAYCSERAQKGDGRK